MAQAGREQECRAALENSVHLEPRLGAGLLQDRDFSSVRERAWFVALAPQTPAHPPGSALELQGALRFESPPIQVQAGELPERFEGWEIRYLIYGPYNQASPGWAQSIAAALQAQLPGATVAIEAAAGPSASSTVTAPEGTPPEQLSRVREVARSIEDVVAQKGVFGEPG